MKNYIVIFHAGPKTMLLDLGRIYIQRSFDPVTLNYIRWALVDIDKHVKTFPQYLIPLRATLYIGFSRNAHIRSGCFEPSPVR